MRTLYVLIPILLITASCKKAEAPQKPPTLVTVAKAKQEDVQLYKTYVGRIEPIVQVEIQAQVEGVLTGFYFTEGDEVQENDLLFTLDERPYVAQLEQAKAALAESIAALRYAEDVASRNAKLAEQDYISKQQYDEYITQVMVKKAEVEQNQAEIESANINITYCNIEAPVSGITGKLNINVGNLIKNAEETPLITLNKITPCYVYFSVPQKDLGKIMRLHRKKPLTVKAFLNGLEDVAFVGDLNLIDNQVDDKTGSIWLRGIFPNEEKLLWPGEFADVRLYLNWINDAILIPSEAVSIGQKGKYVFIIKGNNTAEMRLVETGTRMGDEVIIHSGIKAGEQVVIQGQINLSDGKEVTIKERDQ